MSALVERDDMAIHELACEPVPIARVGAQTVKEEHRRIAPRASFRRPVDVMKTDATSVEPSVGRFRHRP